MEEARLRKLGGSLKVPNVQELAKQQLVAVPPRYIRNSDENQLYSSMLLPQLVPVIDMKILLEGADDDTELNKLHLVCKEWGFFQLVNHGVSSSLMEKVKSEIRAFFDLPMEEKKKFEQEEGDLQGYGQAFVVSKEQKLDWADILYMITLPTHLRKPHLFPKLPASLGLQIKKDGAWIPVPYRRDAFVVNIGDILEIVTNGIYKSTEHRAIVKEDKERISIATVLSPKWDGDLGPAPSPLTPQCPAKFRRIAVADYFKGFFARELVGKSYIDTLRIGNGDDGSN